MRKKLKGAGGARGNALFLILIAVALFAALSYAITQSSRGGGRSAESEKNVIAASQLLQIGSALRATVQRLQLGGVAVENIRLHSNTGPTEACTETDGTCVFDPSGGGMTWPVLPADIFVDASASSYYGFFETGEASRATGMPAISIDGVGTTAPETLFVIAGITDSLCKAINKMAGLEGIPALDSHYADNLPTSILLTAAPGQRTACIDVSITNNGTAPNYFYFVLAEK